MSSPDVKNAHAILRKPLREVAPEHRPDPPYHAGGPLLTCPALDQIRICIWCAEVVSDRVHKGERTVMQRITKLVAGWLDDPKDSTELPELKQGLDALGASPKEDSAALYCLRRAASGTATFMRGKADLVFPAATAAVMRVVKELTADPTPMTTRAFLGALDVRLMMHEMAGAHRDKIKGPPPAIERVLFRAGDKTGKAAYWIARLEGGEFGFLGRLGDGPRPKWNWITGSRDHVLASVPDALFAEATARLS